MAAGALSGPAPICTVGIPALRDFPAGLCAANLAARGHAARAVTVDLDVGRIETNAVTLARRFDDPAFRAAFADGLAPLLRDGERVGMPAVLGLRDPHGAWTDLQERLGARCSRSRRCRRRPRACGCSTRCAQRCAWAVGR